MKSLKLKIDGRIIINLCLSLLFIFCLFDMPYGYYQLVRFLGMAGFIILAYFDRGQHIWLTIWIFSALLIQPFIKVALGRDIWNIVDILWVILLLLNLILYLKQKKFFINH